MRAVLIDTVTPAATRRHGRIARRHGRAAIVPLPYADAPASAFTRDQGVGRMIPPNVPADWPNRAHSRLVRAAGLRWHVQVMGPPDRAGAAPPAAARHRCRDPFLARPGALAGPALHRHRAGSARARLHRHAGRQAAGPAGHGRLVAVVAAGDGHPARAGGRAQRRGGGRAADGAGRHGRAPGDRRAERRAAAAGGRRGAGLLAARQAAGRPAAAAQPVRLARAGPGGRGQAAGRYRVDGSMRGASRSMPA